LCLNFVFLLCSCHQLFVTLEGFMLELCLLVLFASSVVRDLSGAKEQPTATGQQMCILLEYTYISFCYLEGLCA
jgi:hypothetical protein